MVAGSRRFIRFKAAKLLMALTAVMLAALMILTPQALATSSTNGGFTLTKTVSPHKAKVGKNITFTITEINNSGIDLLFDEGINDILPSGVTFVSATVDIPPGTCSFNPSASTVNCKNFDMPDGTTATMTVIVKAKKKGSFTNVANDDGNGNTVTASFKVVKKKHHH